MNNKNTFAFIAASRKDDGLSNGYTVGNAITYKFWDSSQNKEISGISAEYLNPEDGSTLTAPTYSINGSSFVKLTAIGNQIPISNAGPDQTVKEGELVTLDGSASSDPNSDPLAFLWIAPVGITLNSTTTSKATFNAPSVSSDNRYIFSLVVNDGILSSVADQIVITVVKPTGIDPLIENTEVQFFYNPTKGYLRLNFTNTPEKGTWITVYNISGKVVSKSLAENVQENIDLKGNPAGLYFIKINQKTNKLFIY